MFKGVKENEPKKMKRHGRKVKNFDDSKWDTSKKEIVMMGNILKFSQNEELKQMLLNTNNMELIEASPRDNIWGIGISKEKALNGEKWKGKNLLGKILMEVRDIIMNYKL